MAQTASHLVANPVHSLPRVPALGHTRFLIWLAALTVLVGVIAASYLAYTATVSTTSYNVQRLTAERAAWQARNDQLRVELAKVRSLAFVEHEALGRLGMRKATQVTYLPIDPRSVPAPAAVQR